MFRHTLEWFRLHKMITWVLVGGILLLTFVMLYLSQDTYQQITYQEEEEEQYDINITFVEDKSIKDIYQIKEDIESILQYNIESYGFGIFVTDPEYMGDSEFIESYGFKNGQVFERYYAPYYYWGEFTGKDSDIVVGEWDMQEETVEIKGKKYNVTGMGGLPGIYNMTISAYQKLYDKVSLLSLGLEQQCTSEQRKNLEEYLVNIQGETKTFDQYIEQPIKTAKNNLYLITFLIGGSLLLLSGYIRTILGLQSKEIKNYLLCGASKKIVAKNYFLQMVVIGLGAMMLGMLLLFLLNYCHCFYFTTISKFTLFLSMGGFFFVYCLVSGISIIWAMRKKTLY